MDLNKTLRMRHGTFGPGQRPEGRGDFDGAEARTGWFDAADGCQKIIIGTGTPGVAVGTGWLGPFGKGGQTHGQHIPPGLKQSDILLRQTRFFHCPNQVISIIESTLNQTLVVGDPLNKLRLFFRRDQACQNRHYIGVLAESLFLRRIGKQLSTVIPAQTLCGLFERFGHGTVFLGGIAVLESIHQVGGLCEGVGQLQCDNRAVAVFGAVGDSANAGFCGPLPAIGPVHEIPPFHRPQHAVGVDAVFIPVQNASYSDIEGLYKGRIIHVHPVIMNHGNPEQRKGGDYLGHGGWIAAGGQAIGGSGVIEKLDGIAYEPIIAGDIKRDESLDAGIADILKLFVIRTIEIRFTGTEPGRTPADLPDCIE